MLVFEPEVGGELQLFLAELAGFVQQVQRQVGVGQVQARADRRGPVAQAVKDVAGLAQQINRRAVAALAERQIAEVDVDASEGSGGALFGVGRAGGGVQHLGFAQAVEVGQRRRRIVVQRGQVEWATDRGDHRASAIEESQRAGVVVLLEIDQADHLIENSRAELLTELAEYPPGTDCEAQRLGRATQAAQTVDGARVGTRGVAWPAKPSIPATCFGVVA